MTCNQASKVSLFLFFFPPSNLFFLSISFGFSLLRTGVVAVVVVSWLSLLLIPPALPPCCPLAFIFCHLFSGPSPLEHHPPPHRPHLPCSPPLQDESCPCEEKDTIFAMSLLFTAIDGLGNEVYIYQSCVVDRLCVRVNV
jgi:hypothetical protein